MKKTYDCKLLKKRELAQGIFDFVAEAPEIAQDTAPGQFLHIECGGDAFLRRPISICDAQGRAVRFVFEVKGKGTELLARKEPGDTINIMGPLGNGFTVSDKYQHPVLVGGGIGVFPLYKLAKLTAKPEIILGFRTMDRIIMQDEFDAVSAGLQISTDDGSYGYHGYAAALLEKYIAENPCDIIYSCGPIPMLKAVKTVAEKAGIPCQLSLEQRMGCGIGACLVCTCETTRTGMEQRARVCKDGPVFWSEEIVL